MKINKLLIAFLVLAASSLLALNAGSKPELDNGIIVLSKNNLIVLSGEIDGENVSKAILQARNVDASGSHLKFYEKQKPMYLFLNTPGGSIQSGLELIEALHGLNRPINTVTLFAASMGFQLVQNLGDRFVLQNGVMMSHSAYGQIAGNFGGHGPSQMDSRYGLWLTRMLELDKQTVNRTNGKQTLESYQKAYDHELWRAGSQSVEEGYSDKVVLVKCDESLAGVTKNSTWFFGLEIAYDMDNCPLNTSPMNVRIVDPKKEPTEKKDEKKKDTEKKKDRESDDEGDIAFASYQRSLDVKAKFIEYFTNKQRSVIPMYW